MHGLRLRSESRDGSESPDESMMIDEFTANDELEAAAAELRKKKLEREKHGGKLPELP